MADTPNHLSRYEVSLESRPAFAGVPTSGHPITIVTYGRVMATHRAILVVNGPSMHGFSDERLSWNG
jgi:hypothetical protein